MTVPPGTIGRRERNKQDKRDRIMAAASELFRERGINDVTTQQIADRADIGTGTLFLYAKTKGELLLMVQNSLYAGALTRGSALAEEAPTVHDAVGAIVRAVVECNRERVDNGRTYLKEMLFGEQEDPHRLRARELAAETTAMIATTIVQRSRVTQAAADGMAGVVSAVMYVTMSAADNSSLTVDQIMDMVEGQIRVVLPS